MEQQQKNRRYRTVNVNRIYDTLLVTHEKFQTKQHGVFSTEILNYDTAIIGTCLKELEVIIVEGTGKNQTFVWGLEPPSRDLARRVLERYRHKQMRTNEKKYKPKMHGTYPLNFNKLIQPEEPVKAPPPPDDEEIIIDESIKKMVEDLNKVPLEFVQKDKVLKLTLNNGIIITIDEHSIHIENI